MLDRFIALFIGSSSAHHCEGAFCPKQSPLHRWGSLRSARDDGFAAARSGSIAPSPRLEGDPNTNARHLRRPLAQNAPEDGARSETGDAGVRSHLGVLPPRLFHSPARFGSGPWRERPAVL